MPDGIELFDEKKDRRAKVISSGEIKKSRKGVRYLPKDVEEWTIPHFVLFAKISFENRYNKQWGLNFTGCCTEVAMVHDRVYDELGFCTNKVLRDYIKWFMDNQCDYFVSQRTGFFFRHLRHQIAIKKFSDHYSLEYDEKSVIEETKASQSRIRRGDYDTDQMDVEFLLNEQTFMKDYGIVVFINWLVEVKGMKLSLAAKRAYLLCCKSHKEGSFKEIADATYRRSPYPESWTFKQADKLAKKVDESLTVTSDFGAIESPF